MLLAIKSKGKNMGFRNSAAQTQTKETSKTPGGKYAGIRPARPSNNKLKPGEYVIEFVRTYKSRTESSFMFDAKVMSVVEDSANATQVGETALGLINIGGRSYDVGMPVLVSLVMALCQCESQEQLNAEEPDWDLLLDALCEEERGTSSQYGSNPAAGKLVWCRAWHGKLDTKGEPYTNFEFRAHFDEPKHEPKRALKI